MSNSQQLTFEALRANPLQISFTHDNVLQILPPADGEYRVSLCTAKTPSPVLLADHVQHGSFILKHDLIVAQKFGQCYNIEVVRLSDDKNLDLHKYTLLEDLGMHAFSRDKNLQLQNWRGLAILSGMVLTTDRGFRQKSEVMSMLRTESGLLRESLALQKKWPFAFIPVTGDPALLLIQYFGLLINEGGLICSNFKPIDLEPENHFQTYPHAHAEYEVGALAHALGPVKAKLHLVNLPEIPTAVPSIIHVGLQESVEEKSSPMFNSPSSLLQEARDQIQATAGLGNRLNAPYDSVVSAGLASGKFKKCRKVIQPGTKWVIFIVNYGVDGQGKHGMQSLIMKEKNEKRLNKKNSCVLRVGKANEKPLIGQREVILWKVVAACFGVYAMSNQDMLPQPLLHPRTKDFIKDHLPRILELIDLWPYKDHESLKPFARARAQAIGEVVLMPCNTARHMSETLALARSCNPTVEPTAEPIIEPITEPITEPVIEPITEPIPESVAALVAPSVMGQDIAQEEDDRGRPHEFSLGIDDKVARMPIITDVYGKSNESNSETKNQTMTPEKTHDISAALALRAASKEHEPVVLRARTRAPRASLEENFERVMTESFQSNQKAFNALAVKIKGIEEQNLCRQITIEALTLEIAESSADVERFKVRMEMFRSTMSAC